MTKTTARPRKQRREDDRAARKTVRQKQRMLTVLPGGAAAHPLEVSTAAVVEVHARAIACIHCDGQLSLREDRATSTPRGVLRELEMVCRLCHAPRHLWFRIAPSLPS